MQANRQVKSHTSMNLNDFLTGNCCFCNLLQLICWKHIKDARLVVQPHSVCQPHVWCTGLELKRVLVGRKSEKLNSWECRFVIQGQVTNLGDSNITSISYWITARMRNCLSSPENATTDNCSVAQKPWQHPLLNWSNMPEPPLETSGSGSLSSRVKVSIHQSVCMSVFLCKNQNVKINIVFWIKKDFITVSALNFMITQHQLLSLRHVMRTPVGASAV